MAENYDLIFGQSASQQYAWSDSDYQNGWQTVGSTPPTAEQFDALQRRSDTKAQDLNNRLLPIEEKSEADGRQAATTYTAGAMLTVDGLPNGWLLQCIVPGISGTDAITLPDTLIDGLTIIDGDVTWALRKVATNGGLGYRQPSTAYTAGQIAYHASIPTGWYLECTTTGTTSSSALVISSPSIGNTVTDGTVVWEIKSLQIKIDDSYKLLYDCNEIMKTGFSSIPSSASNIPASFGGRMLTLSRDNNYGYVQQLFFDNDIEYHMYHRCYRNDAWTPWRMVDEIVAKSLGTNGYIKYASGLIVQWGIEANVAADTQINITYPISFTTTPSCSVVGQTSVWSDYSAINLIAPINTTLRFRSSKALANVYWFAIGY